MARSYRAIFPASGIVHWADGSSASQPGDMALIRRRMQVVFDEAAGHPAPPPIDLKVLHREGGFAFWQSGDAREALPNTGDEDAYDLAARAAYRLRGTVSDPLHDYSPRRFDLEVPAVVTPAPPTTTALDNIILYPTPKGVRPGQGGAIRGTLRWPAAPGEERGPRAPWALLELTLVADNTVVFRALSDRNGDFVVPMPGLPAASEGIATQALQLSIRASEAADPRVWPSDPEGQAVVDVGQLKLEYPGKEPAADPDPGSIPFTDQPGLAVQPGKTGLIRTVQHDHVVVQVS